MKSKKVLEHTVTFERRRYGGRHGVTYTWAYLHISDKRVCLGDPYPAINWPMEELRHAIECELKRSEP